MQVVRWISIVFAIGLVLAGAVAAAALYSPFGQQIVRDEVASWISGRLGRALHIDGDLRIALGRDIRISARRVRLANPSWASRADMVVARQVTIELDARSLLSRSPTLIVNDIGVSGLDVSLERTPDGDENWQFATSKRDPGPVWHPALPLVVQRISLPGARIEFNGPRLDRPLLLTLDDFEQRRGANDMLDFVAKGRANETDMSLSGKVGPFENLIDAKAFSATLDARVGELSLSAKARIDSLARPVDSEVNVVLSGPDAAYVTSRFSVRNLGDGPFNLALSVSRSASGQGVRGTLEGHIGEFDLSADGELSEPTRMGKLTLRTEMSGPDAGLLAGIIGYDVLPPERFHFAATVRRSGTLLQIDEAELELPDSQLSVRGSIKHIDNPSGDDLTIHLAGASIEKFRKLLNLPGFATGPFDITATTRPGDGGDQLDLAATTALGKLSAVGTLGAYPDYFGTRLRFTVSGGDFVPFARQLGLSISTHEGFSGQGTLDWTESGIALNAASLQVQDDTLNLDGTFGKAPAFETNAKFQLRGKSLAKVAAYAGWSGLPAQPYEAAGRLRHTNGQIQLEGIELSAAGARVQLSGTLARSPQQDTALAFNLVGRDLQPFSALAKPVALPSGPFRAQGGVRLGNHRLRLSNLRVEVAGSQATVETDVALPLGTSVGNRPNRFDIRASGAVLRRLFPALAHTAAQQRFDLQATGTFDREFWSFGTLHLDTPIGFVSVQGKLDRAPDHSATDMRIQARTADPHVVGALFGIDLPAQPLDFTAVISGTFDAFHAAISSGHFGRSDFAGSVELDLHAKPTFDIQIRSNLLDLTPLFDAVADRWSVPSPVVSDSRTIPDIELPTKLLDRVNARVAIQSAQVDLFGRTYQHLQLHGSLQDGHLLLDPVAFDGADGNLNVRLAVGSDLSAPNVRLAANGDQIRLDRVPGVPRITAASVYKVQIDVAGTGLKLRDLVATLNGKIRLIGEGGRIPNSRINAALSSDFLSQLGRTLNPLSKHQAYTDVVCQAYLFDAGDGRLQTDPAIALRTSGVDIVSNGSVNLRNEAIDFNFKTAARGGLGISAGELLNNYVKVSGTLSKPHLTVDATGTLVNGGAAFATGGLSILATTLWDRASRKKGPCAAAVAEADQRYASRKSWW